MKVLCCTKNLELALLRQRVLEQAHFEVEISDNDEQVLERIERDAQSYDALVLCHSLTTKSAKQYARLMKEHNPKCCVAYIAKTPWEKPDIPYDIRVPGIEGPQKLIESLQSCESPAQ